MVFNQSFVPFLLAFSGVACVGCGDSALINVEGNVTLDGQPVQSGSIRFQPIDGRGMTSGGPIQDGRYRVEMTEGKMRVEIRSSRSLGRERLYPEGPEVEQIEESISNIYNSQSKLQIDVSPQQATHDFKLHSDP